MRGKIRLIQALSAIAVFAFILVLFITGAFSYASSKLEDRMYQSYKGGTSDICYIGIDDNCIREYGIYDSWIRSKLVEVIDFLTADKENKPKVIAVDLDLSETSDSTVDTKLATSIKNAGNVILSSSVAFSEKSLEYSKSLNKKASVTSIKEPFDELKKSAAGVGHSTILTDQDNVVRHAIGSLYCDGENGKKIVFSFDEMIYKAYNGYHSPYANNNFYIGYSNISDNYYSFEKVGHSMKNVLNGIYASSVFKDKIVYIGITSTKLQSSFSIPNSQELYGLELHANILNQLIEDRKITEINNFTQIAILIVILLITLCCIYLPLKMSFIYEIILGILYIALTKICTSSGVLLPLFTPTLTIMVLCAVCIFIKYYMNSIENRRLVTTYGPYLSPEIALTLTIDEERDIDLWGEKREVAILSIEIKGFSNLMKKVEDQKVFDTLNSYLDVISNHIVENEGMVDKIVDNSVRAIFNAPLKIEDYIPRAIETAIAIMDQAQELEEKLPEECRNEIGLGIGVHGGEVLMGTVGSDFRMDYTAIGDAVSESKFLEQYSLKGEILISEYIYERIKNRVECEELGVVKDIKVYKVLKLIVE